MSRCRLVSAAVIALLFVEHTTLAQVVIKMKRRADGTLEVPVEINRVLKINFIFDSGASEVFISPDIALTLIKTGTVQESDWLPSSSYIFADGSTARSRRFLIRELSIGGHTLKNVPAAISNSIEASLLLGQSALNRFGSFTIDYQSNTLSFEGEVAEEADWAYERTSLSSILFGSQDAKDFVNGWLFEAGYTRTNFSDPAYHNISRSYAEGFNFSMGYASLPFIFRLDAFVEQIETIPDLYGETRLVHNGVLISACYTVLPSLESVFPYGGVGQQIIISEEYDRQVATTSPVWIAGVQINLAQFLAFSETLGGWIFRFEYRQTINDLQSRRNDLNLTVGFRMRGTS